MREGGGPILTLWQERRQSIGLVAETLSNEIGSHLFSAKQESVFTHQSSEERKMGFEELKERQGEGAV